jgi:hypothetical protein
MVWASEKKPAERMNYDEMSYLTLVTQAVVEGKRHMDELGEAADVSTRENRPRALLGLMALEGVNSLFGLIWPVFVPTFSPGASQPWGVRPVALVMVMYGVNIISGGRHTLRLRQGEHMLIGVTILFRVKHTLSRNLASQADLSKVLRKSSALQEGARKHVVHRLQERHGSW